MRLINAERKVHLLAYDDEHEENIVRYMTVEEMLDEFTDEGCPTIIFDPVKHGLWIETEEDGDKVVHCSVCSDEYVEVLELAPWVKKYFHYCPNCGARMDGENDETD